MSEANRVSLRYVAEATAAYGSTPAATTWKAIRMTSESLAAVPKTVVSNEIRSDRMVANMPKVGIDVNGAINFEFTRQDFDDFIEAAMCGTWATNVVKIGVVDRSFSIEKQFEDQTTTAIIAFKGMRVGQMSFNIAYGAIITGAVNFMGNAATVLAASQSSAITSATANEAFDGAGGITAITIDGASVDSTYFRSVAFTINNNQRAIEAMGNDAPSDIKKGRANVTGNLTAYFDDTSLYTKLLANTAIDFKLTMSDGTGTYLFRAPKAKFSSGAPNATGIDTDVMQSLDFTCLYDSSAGTSLSVTRT